MPLFGAKIGRCTPFWRSPFSKIYFSTAVVGCRTQLRELRSDLGTRHLLQVGRSAERRSHSYVDHSSSGCYSVFRACPRHPTKHRDTTTVSPTCAKVCCLLWDVKHNPKEVLLLPIKIHLTLRTPWGSGTLAGLLLPSCFIVVPLLDCVWNSGTAPVDVYQ